MIIKQTIIGRSSGKPFEAVYRDIDSVEEVKGLKIKAARAYCFLGDKIVIVFEEGKNYWNYPGGGLEPDETLEDGIRREVREESNMRIVEMRPLGLQEVHLDTGLERYVRFACIVEPIGDFVSDPGKEVLRIDALDPEKAYELADKHWGKIGRHMLERAIEYRNSLK
jgi:ADP-ribose pyrophosphatase YjhB (NUDIX family)